MGRSPNKKITKMEKKLMNCAIALLAVFALTMTSCSKDDETTPKIEFQNVEIGHGGAAIIGKDIHLACKIFAEAKVKYINVSMKQKDGSSTLEKLYNDSKYVNVIDPVFHEHLILPETLAEGVYVVTISVKDMVGTTKSVSQEVKLTKQSSTAPVVTNLEILNPKTGLGVVKAKAGDMVLVKAHIEAAKIIKDMELEFHGKDEKPVALTDAQLKKYIGKKSVDFAEQIMVPADAPAGEYHFHFTVEDEKGQSATGEFEGFQIQ